jgi:guanyl-specific ribonuclease Sa
MVLVYNSLGRLLRPGQVAEIFPINTSHKGQTMTRSSLFATLLSMSISAAALAKTADDLTNDEKTAVGAYSLDPQGGEDLPVIRDGVVNVMTHYAMAGPKGFRQTSAKRRSISGNGTVLHQGRRVPTQTLTPPSR